MITFARLHRVFFAVALIAAAIAGHLASGNLWTGDTYCGRVFDHRADCGSEFDGRLMWFVWFALLTLGCAIAGVVGYRRAPRSPRAVLAVVVGVLLGGSVFFGVLAGRVLIHDVDNCGSTLSRVTYLDDAPHCQHGWADQRRHSQQAASAAVGALLAAAAVELSAASRDRRRRSVPV